MKIFKRILLSFALVAALMFAVACEEKPVKTNNNPVIHGAKDQTIEKGTRFIPLDGITATDEEDGILTDSIVYTGNVNVNRVGEYTVTYTVYDSDGNKAEVTITVTVVLTDNEAPMLTGVADKQILVGEAFDPRAGVAATDAIDGNVDFTVEGEVNIWKVGEYVLTYKAEDEAGNKASSERTITVSLGNFEFYDNVIAPEAVYENGVLTATVSSGPIDTSLAPFGLAELKFKASNATAADLSFTLTNATSQNKVSLTTTEKEYTVYFRLNQEITDGQLKLTGPASAVVTNVTLRFGVAVDSEAPVITIPEDYAVFLPGSITDPAVLKPFIIKGVTAQDNVDGNVTSKLDVDFGNLVLGELDTLEEITIFAVDKAGNRAEAKVNVQFLTTYATDIIKDPGFDTGSAEADNWILNGGAGEKRLEFIDGVMIHEVKGQADAGWDSASSPALRYEQGVFRAGNWYMLKFDAKATVARNMTVRIGLDTTEALGWIENFKGAHNYPIDLTTEIKTYHVIFFVHAEKSQGGYGTVKVELKLGTFYWDKSKELNNPVTFDNFQFYLMSNVDNPPELTVDSSLPTKFGKGATVDFKPYVSAYDLEDAKHITITDAMIDLSGVNMNAAGVYTVVYTVADSQGNEATLELEIEVLATADTEAPVIAEVAGLVKTVDQFSDPIVLKECVTVTDNVDTADELIVTITGSVDVNKAGTYEVVYKARDLSGNQSEHTITFTVLDKEAPKFASDLVEDGILKVKQGKELDLTKVFRVNDNVDGPIALTMDNITGADAFMVGGKAEVLGEFEVTYKVQDAAGNEATVVITVIVEEAFELVEGNVLVDGLGQPGFTNGNSSALTVTEQADGSLKLEVVDIGGWTSFAHLKLDVTGASAINNYYLVRMKLKASKVREVQVKVGKSLGEDPWYNFFEIVEGRETFSVTEEYMVYEMIYKANQENVTQAYLEFRFGSGLANAANGDIIYVEQFEVIELVKEQLVEGHVMLDVLWDQMFANGNSASSTIAYADGMATFTVSDIGGWASYAHAKVNIGSLDQGKNYKVIVEIKGSSERKVLINMGCQLNQDPWYEYYTSKGALEFTIGTEFAIHEIEFVVDKDTTANRYLEFRYGKLSGAANGDVITVKQFKIVEMVSSNEPPVTEAKVSFVAPENGEFTVVSVDYDGGSMTPNPVSDGGMVPIGHYIVVNPTPAEGYVLKSVKINGKVVPQTMGFYAFKVINGKDLSVSVDFALEATDPNIIDITGNTKDGYADYTFSGDFMTVTVGTAAGKWGRFDFDRITRPANRARATFSGGEGLKLQVKLDSNNPNNTYDSKLGNKQTKELLAGEVVFEWDLDALEIDSNILEKLVFWVYENGATSGEFKLVSLELYYVNPNDIEITGNSQGGSTFAFSEDFKTVTVNAVGNQWGRFNFARITRPANRARVTILGGEGLTLLLKLDSNNPNNTYDSKPGNKTSKGLTSGETVYEWDLEALGMDASILEKLVFWAYNNGSSTGEFTLVSLELYYEEPAAATEAKVNFAPATNGSYIVVSVDYDGGSTTPSPVTDGGMVPVGHYIVINPTAAEGYQLQSVKVNDVVVSLTSGYYAYKVLDGTELTVTVTFEAETPEPPAAQAKVNHSPATNGSYVVDSYNGAGGDYTMHPVSDGGMVNVGHSIRIIATPADGFVVSQVKVNETILEFVYDSYAYIISDETELTVYVTFVEAPEPPATSYVAEIHTNNVGNAIYTWEANKKTVNCSAVPASMTQWA
ncbi:MAG TPA: DUF5011 domain-containing protein, partial [Acholeplasmataceae bacterium]|nr:DUF5011 domain-containing protein [Acholeplasmataceae bacterium]